MKTFRERITEKRGRAVTVILLLLALFLAYFVWNQYNIEPLYFSNGVADLRPKDISSTNFQLKGEMAFYPDQLVLTPDDISKLQDPVWMTTGSWNSRQRRQYEWRTSGAGTYHFTIISDKPEVLGLDLGQIHTAYKVWVNERPYYSMGRIAYDREKAVPRVSPKVVSFDEVFDTLQVYISVSNFHHAKSGIIQPIYLSSADRVVNLRESAIIREMAIIAFIMAFAFYNCFLLFVGVKNNNYLIYALFCFFISVRQSMFGSYIMTIIYDNISYQRLELIGYISLYAGFALAVRLVAKSGDKAFSKAGAWICYSMAVTFAVAAIAFPGWWNYYLSLLFYFASILGLAYINIVYLKLIARKHFKVPVFIIGTSLALIIFIHDFLAMLEIITPEYLEIYAMLFIVAFQSLYLSYRYKVIAGRLNYTSKDISKIGMITKVQEAHLKDVIDKIDRVLPAVGEASVRSDLKRTIDFIENKFLNSDQKFVLESYDKTNEEFASKLLSTYPDLTHGEIELCGYIRAKFNSKKIAEIKNISPQSVNKAKFRLRKKMNLERKQDLYRVIGAI